MCSGCARCFDTLSPWLVVASLFRLRYRRWLFSPGAEPSPPVDRRRRTVPADGSPSSKASSGVDRKLRKDAAPDGGGLSGQFRGRCAVPPLHLVLLAGLAWNWRSLPDALSPHGCAVVPWDPCPRQPPSLRLR